ncbi:MAG: fluoride efflux transporter CrcB [Zoogloeaceae bacterium]|jgi:CrcB protein|nr:fluoride efflux transporter CrcB [Zoogloeaceae bacterium]
MNYLHFAAVGLGAALGAWSRWLLGLLLNPLVREIPLGTLAANLSGCYLVGIALGVFHLHAEIPLALKLFVITGFLGGLTTFSTFSAETTERLLSGQTGMTVLMIVLHLLGSLLLTILGLATVGAARIWS